VWKKLHDKIRLGEFVKEFFLLKRKLIFFLFKRLIFLTDIFSFQKKKYQYQQF